MSIEEQANETANYEVSVSDAAVAPEIKEPEQEPAEAAATSEPENDATKQDPAADAGEEAQSEPQPGKGRFQKRIDRLTKRAAEAERRAQEAERRLAETAKVKQDKPAAKAAEPDPSSFDSYDDYLDALAGWEDGQEQQEAPDEQETDAGKEQGKKQDKTEVDQDFVDALDDVNEAFADTRKQHSDFDEVIGQPDLMISRDMVLAMAEADDPGAIAYHLGKNKAEAERISKLSPVAQAREIGKLEVKLSAEPKAPSKKTTAAPAPIDPVKGGDGTKKSVSDMDFNEYEQYRNEREQRGGRGFW